MKYLLPLFLSTFLFFSGYSQSSHKLDLEFGSGWHSNIFKHSGLLRQVKEYNRNDLWLSKAYSRAKFDYEITGGSTIKWQFNSRAAFRYYYDLNQKINPRIVNSITVGHALGGLKSKWTAQIDIARYHIPNHFSESMVPLFSRNIFVLDYKLSRQTDGGFYWRTKLMGKFKDYRSDFTALDKYWEFGGEIYLSNTFLEYVNKNRLRWVGGFFKRNYLITRTVSNLQDDEIIILPQNENQATRHFNYYRTELTFIHAINQEINISVGGHYERRVDTKDLGLNYHRLMPRIAFKHKSAKWSNQLSGRFEWKMYDEFKPYDSSESLKYLYWQTSISSFYHFTDEFAIGISSFWRSRDSNLEAIDRELYRSYKTWHAELKVKLSF